MANSRKRYGWITPEPCFSDRVLNAICRLGPCSREELIRYMHESRGSIYPTINRLVEVGFVREMKMHKNVARELETTPLGFAKRDMMVAVQGAAKEFEKVRGMT